MFSNCKYISTLHYFFIDNGEKSNKDNIADAYQFM